MRSARITTRLLPASVMQTVGISANDSCLVGCPPRSRRRCWWRPRPAATTLARQLGVRSIGVPGERSESAPDGSSGANGQAHARPVHAAGVPRPPPTGTADLTPTKSRPLLRGPIQCDEWVTPHRCTLKGGPCGSSEPSPRRGPCDRPHLGDGALGHLRIRMSATPSSGTCGASEPGDVSRLDANGRLTLQIHV
jgi:hypothetical protein